MGGAPSLDSEMKEMKDKTATFLVEFAKQYTIFTAAGILKKQEKDAKIAGERSKYELKWVPEKPEHPDRHQGYVERRTTILKKWKKIYLVVRGNWLLEYWETEEDFKAKKKPENSINLSGTYLYRDPFKEAMEKLEKFCAKAKIDISDIPKPEQLPEFTIKMQDWSERRPELLFKCANEEEYNKWKKMLDNARYYVDDLSIEDEVHRYAFPRALRRARWASGCWGYFWGGGGEYQYLTDSIVDAIEDAVMPSVDNKLYEAKMPYFLRSRVRKSFVSTCNSFVSGGVKPARLDKVHKTADEYWLLSASTSVDFPAPEGTGKGAVRGHNDACGSIIFGVKNKKGKWSKRKCKMVFLYQSNPKGWIPSSAVNAAITGEISRLIKFVQRQLEDDRTVLGL